MWTGGKDAKMLRVDKILLENGEKKLRFQTNTDTCGQGLRETLKPGTGRQNKIDYHTKFTNQDRFTKGLCRESTSGYIAHNYLLISQP